MNGFRVLLACAGVALLSAAAQADVICKRKSGVLVARGACKAREAAIDLSAFGGVGPTGPTGPSGEVGPPGPAGRAGFAGPGARWALVKGDGTVLAQSGGISVPGVGTGVLYLDFGESVALKAISATPAYLDDDTARRGSLVTALCGGGPQGARCQAEFDDDHHVLVVSFNSANNANESHAVYVAVY